MSRMFQLIQEISLYNIFFFFFFSLFLLSDLLFFHGIRALLQETPLVMVIPMLMLPLLRLLMTLLGMLTVVLLAILP